MSSSTPYRYRSTSHLTPLRSPLAPSAVGDEPDQRLAVLCKGIENLDRCVRIYHHQECEADAAASEIGEEGRWCCTIKRDSVTDFVVFVISERPQNLRWGLGVRGDGASHPDASAFTSEQSENIGGRLGVESDPPPLPPPPPPPPPPHTPPPPSPLDHRG